MKPNEDVNMVRHHLQRKQHETAVLRDLPENTLTLTLNVTHQDTKRVFWFPHQMETALTTSMAHAKHIHFGILHTAALQRPAEGGRAAVWNKIRNPRNSRSPFICGLKARSIQATKVIN